LSNLRDSLVEAFGLNDVLAITPVRPDPLTIGWCVDVLQDTRAKRWCVKKHRNQQPQRLAFEAAFARAMNASLSYIPAPVWTRDGNAWFEADGAIYSAQQWIDCDAPCDWLNCETVSIERCATAGAGLAEFHAAAARVVTQLPRGWEAVARPFLPLLPSAVEHGFNRALRELPSTDLIGSIVARCREQALGTLSQLMTRLQELSVMPIIVHGDFHPGNALFHGDRLVGIVDFDYVHLDQPLYDVGYAAYMFSRHRTVETSDVASIDATKLSAFVRAYSDTLAASWVGGLVPRVDPEILNVYLHLGAFMVAYWLLNVYIDEPDQRVAITLPLTQSLLDTSRTMEPWRGTLYI
jgi:Ser/Thr protein kinase RdoA (MazF antagonist)